MNPSEITPSSETLPGASGFSGLPPRAQGELLLVADDQDSVRELLDTILTDHGYRTVLAADGDEAITRFAERAGKYAAVLSDMNMPRRGGESLAEALRELQPGIPILFMSGLGSGETGQELRPANSGEPFLLKPFRPVMLLDALHRLLHPPGSNGR